ncbi:MAG: hypothetical protein ACE5K1_11655 [Acidiferrobacterales bacterium]
MQRKVTTEPLGRDSRGPGKPVGLESAARLAEAESGDPVEAIEKAFKRRDSRALKHYQRRLNLTVFSVALGPVAVLLLATQVLVYPEGGVIGSTLIAIELAVLTLVLAVGFLQMGRSHRLWIRERLRAEVLRREEFLLRARVGPYLGTQATALGERVSERLVTIDSEVNDPVALLRLQDEGENWRDALEDAKHNNTLGITPDFADNLQAYLTQRTKRQREWFSENSSALGKHARFYENGARLVVVLALIIAALHLGWLNADHDGGFMHTLLIVIAIVAPAIGSAFVGLQSVSGSQRLSRSHAFHAHALERLEKIFRRIQLKLEQSGAADDDLQFQFQRAVLGTEELLSSELYLWWLIMHTEAPRASA